MSEVIEHQNVTNMFAVLERAATNPDVDADKIERLYAVMMQEQASQAARAWNASMVAAQKEMDPIRKDKEGDKGWYAKLATLAQKVTEVFTLNDLFLSFSQAESPMEGHIRVIADVGHSLGHTVQRFVDIPLEDKSLSGKKIMTDIHATGSAFTYGRRYLTLMLANIPTPDDDGKAAGETAECITSEQAQQVHDLIASQADDFGPRMLAWLNENNVASVEEIPAKHWQKYWAEIQKAAG